MKLKKIIVAGLLLAAMPTTASATYSPAEQSNGKCLFIFPIAKWFGYMYLPCNSGAANRF